MNPLTPLMLSTVLVAAGAPAPANHAEGVEQWRRARVERLTQPQGWLSLVGLHWIEPGSYRVGRASDNAIVLATGPAHLGTIAFADGKLRFTPHAEAEVAIADTRVAGEIELHPDSSDTPTTLVLGDGEATIQPIERAGRIALRVRDANAASRTEFAGIDYYPIRADWRFDARFEPHPEGQTIPIANVIGQLEPMKNPGTVVFERDGKTFRLEAVDEGDGQLFLIFADRTSGRETYGAGRFLYAAPAVDGRTEVDFNRAYNPPCAFNEYSTCPLPPPENRLDLAVVAGEKAYDGPAHSGE
jgi:uncharacterized protein (DUF1684 family)